MSMDIYPVVGPMGTNSILISAGASSSNVSGVTFSNANGVSFGYDGTNVTATVATNYQSSGAYLTTAMASNRGSDFVQATAAFHGTNASGTINSNNISVSVAAPANNSINISAGTTSSNVTAVTFSNANGVSFGYDGTNVTATVQTNYLTTAMASNRGSDFVQATAAFHGTNASGTINSNDVSISVAAGTNSSWTVSDAVTSATVGRLAFTNSNGLTLSLSTSNNGNHTVIGSYTVPSVTNSSLTLSDAATSMTIARLAFTNSNGLTLSLSTTTGGSATLVGSYTVPNVPAATSWTVSDAVTSATVGRLAFTNSNGLTLSLSTSNNGNHTVIGSYTVPAVTNSSLTLSDSATSMTIGRLAFTGSNGLTLTLSTTTGGSATLIGSYTVPSTAGLISAVKISAGASSSNVSAVTFSNSNGVSFGYDGTVITATVQTNYLTTAALSSQTLVFSLGGNSGTTNSSQISNGGYVLAGGANITINQSNNSVSVVGAAAGAVNFSAGGTSNNLSSIVFSNSNGVSFGLSGSTVTATVQTNYLTTAALSSQTLAFSLGGNSGTTNSSQILNGGYVLAGGNNVTINQSNATVSISAGVLNVANSQTTYSNSTLNLLEGGGAITIASSAGGQSFKFSVPQTSSLVGVNGISISTAGSTISVSQTIIGTASYFANLPKFIDDNSTTFSCGTSVLQVAPFALPYPISASFLRVPVSMSQVSTESAATTANTSFTFNRSYTDMAIIYTQLSGASSLSLGAMATASASWVFQYSFTAAGTGSRYTVSQNVTWPSQGTYSNSAVGNSAQSSANIGFSTNLLTAFTGLRFVDLLFASSLSAGNYWIAFGRSTNSASNAAPAGMSGASMGISSIGLSHSNVVFGRPGEATNSSILLMPGLGSWSTNSAVLSTASIQLASVSIQSSIPIPYFQMQRFA